MKLKITTSTDFANSGIETLVFAASNIDDSPVTNTTTDYADDEMKSIASAPSTINSAATITTIFPSSMNFVKQLSTGNKGIAVLIQAFDIMENMSCVCCSVSLI